MAWPFTNSSTPKKRERFVARITIKTESGTLGGITSGTAFFEDNPNQSITLPVPIDALGKLILTYTNNLRLTHVAERPSFKDSEHDAIYLICEQTSTRKWIASLGGRNLNSRFCKCPHETLDWKISKDWETPERAVGMLFFTNSIGIDWLMLNYDHSYLRLKHPTDVDMGDGHCCCC